MWYTDKTVAQGKQRLGRWYLKGKDWNVLHIDNTFGVGMKKVPGLCYAAVVERR